jgi:hypothetical protein
MRMFLAAVAIALVAGTPALAHHSYGDFLRDQTVSIEGTVEHLVFANPHVVFTLRTDEGATYTVEWSNLIQLERQGIRSGMVKVGDRLMASGSPHRDATIQKITLLTEVRPQSGDWRWVNKRADAPATR